MPEDLKSNFSEILFTNVYLNQLKKTLLLQGFLFKNYGMFDLQNHNKKYYYETYQH
jgi:hypothetical protein